jgi:hypothetical protein
MDAPVPLSSKLAGQDEEYVRRHVQVVEQNSLMHNSALFIHNCTRSRHLTLKFVRQGKLEIYIPTATDSVLCDYVLVMVGNKKTRSQIANDLEVGNVPSIPRFVMENWFSDTI